MDVPAELLSQLERFCAFQERCEFDVRKKLTTMPCSVAQRDEIIRRLREHDFLNEERYVGIFVRSKLNDQWGKLKIRQHLYAKKIEPQLIDNALNAVDEEEYVQMLSDTIEKWKRQHAAECNDKPKLVRFLLSRGFGMSEIQNCINS